MRIQIYKALIGCPEDVMGLTWTSSENANAVFFCFEEVDNNFKEFRLGCLIANAEQYDNESRVDFGIEDIGFYVCFIAVNNLFIFPLLLV